MNNPIDNMLQVFPFIVKDGGLATEIEKRGYPLGGRLWSAKILIDNPQIISSVHEDFLIAGADCILTSSYQASIRGFMEEGISLKRSEQLIKLSAKIAVNAREKFISETGLQAHRPYPVIAGSCGSYGAYLANASEYNGAFQLSSKEYKDFHRPRVELLFEGGCDLIAFETFPRIDEAAAVAELMQDYPDRTAWISYTVRDSSTVAGGESFITAVKEISADNISAIGVNCSNPAYFTDLIKTCRSATDKRIVVYPNTGEVFYSSCSCWRGDNLNMIFKNAAAEWHAAGADIIGGCCRIGPEAIHEAAELRKEISGMR